MNAADLLTREEIYDAILRLGRKSRTVDRRRQAWRNELTLFELVTCCGLMAGAIADLRVGQVKTEGNRCWIDNGRFIPLHWLGMVEEHIADHARYRREQMQAEDGSPLLCRFRDRAAGNRLDAAQIYHTYAAACSEAGIGRERARLSTGVSSFAMNCFSGGVDPSQVRAVMGSLLPGEPSPAMTPRFPMYQDALAPTDVICSRKG